MKLVLGTVVLYLLLQYGAIGKRHKMKTKVISTKYRDFQNDDLLVVEPIPPETVRGECTCRCCEPEKLPSPLTLKCPNDIVVAVDSSACFRDYHGRMMRFLKKLVKQISRTKTIQYGGDETRLALMQFSSDITFPLELSSFENFTNPSTNKLLTSSIIGRLNRLPFLGEGAFLNKALNATVNQFEENPRPNLLPGQTSPSRPRRVVILVTNGKSHPSVTMDDIEYSIEDLKSAGVTVLPVSVTGECHGVQSDVWNEGLCPDPVVMNKLAKVGRPDSATFMEMTSHDTYADIINILEACHPSSLSAPSNVCNNCTCSCELPVGPPGPPGPKGQKGDFVEGEDGPKGEQGPKGEVGEKGANGEKGNKGNDGVKGEIGAKGEIGKIGAKGDKGSGGEKGENGIKGKDGNPGEKGVKGNKGVIGEKGNAGNNGTRGDPGKDGKKGEFGEKGVKGAIGPKGEKGLGQKGEKGTDGKEGEKGMSGDKGMDGTKGEKGRAGLCGKPGPAGRKGDEGLAGIDGSDGKQGPPGREGRQGSPGVQGGKGQKGAPGASGVPGTIGLPGERGPEGPAGRRGVKGGKGEPSNEPGVPGIPGSEGKKGETGLNGKDGITGPEGPPGRQGVRGIKGEKGKPGELDLEQLRPFVVDIIRELLPGECAEADPTPPPTTTTTTTASTTTTTTIATTTTEPAPPETTTEPPPPPTEAPTCSEAITDIAIVVDGSTSVKREGYRKLRNFVYSFVNDFNNIGNDGIRIAIVQYSDISKIRVIMDFDQSVNKQAVLNAINTSMTVQSWTGGNTYTGHALSVTSGLYNKRMENKRRDAKQIALVITDGTSHDEVTIPSDNLKKQGVTIFAIGVGDDVNEQSSTVLADIASSPSSTHVFFVDEFDVLSTIKSEILEEICIKAGGVTSVEKEVEEGEGFSGEDV